ncbi:MAG: YceD family protein [Endomicrobiales bacterium]
MKNLKIDIALLKEKGSVEDTVEQYSCTAISDSVSRQQLRAHYTLTLVDSEILLEGDLSGEVTVECCRCLEKFVYPVNLTLKQTYPASVTEIDLEDEIRQTLILHLPTKPLCREDCRGICPQCGKNLNAARCTCTPAPEDPRWGKLKGLIHKK